MKYSRKPIRAGVGIGATGVTISLFATAIIYLIPRFVLAPDQRQSYLETWMEPTATLSSQIETLGIPLLAAGVAIYLVKQSDASIRDTMTGLLIAGLLFGFGVTLINWGVTHPGARTTTWTYIYHALQRAGIVVLVAMIAVLGADFTEHRSPSSDTDQ
ncbi:MAG: hypothetical protein ACI8UR_000098 [Natronomonas sp.]|jgi:hypothetical protein|uniref:hypothetical protein n=1 Tax=Natronomonas sp. TaxID=2184060 RepID=UPI00398976E6